MVQKLEVQRDVTHTGVNETTTKIPAKWVLCGLTTRYLADKLQRGVAVKRRGVERSSGEVVEQKHKQVFQRTPHCLRGTQIISTNIIIKKMFREAD